MKDESEDLMARARAGDRQAREDLLVKHLPSLQAYVRLKAGALVRAKESLTDVAQSVCKEALADLDQVEVRSEGEFRQLLFRMALHKIINKRRYYEAGKRDVHREANQPRDDAQESLLASYATIATPSQHLSRREAMEELEKAFDELPEDYREAITLYRLCGLDYPQIAEQMNRSEGAVRNLVYRGLARLAGQLGKG